MSSWTTISSRCLQAVWMVVRITTTGSIRFRIHARYVAGLVLLIPSSVGAIVSFAVHPMRLVES